MPRKYEIPKRIKQPIFDLACEFGWKYDDLYLGDCARLNLSHETKDSSIFELRIDHKDITVIDKTHQRYHITPSFAVGNFRASTIIGGTNMCCANVICLNDNVLKANEGVIYEDDSRYPDVLTNGVRYILEKAGNLLSMDLASLLKESLCSRHLCILADCVEENPFKYSAYYDETPTSRLPHIERRLITYYAKELLR